MSRVVLDNLNIEGLKDIARQLELDTCGTRAVLMKRLTDYYESHGWPEQITVAGPNAADEKETEDTNSVIPDDPPMSAGSQPILVEDRAYFRPGEGAARFNDRAENSAFNTQEIAQAVAQILQSNYERRQLSGLSSDPFSRTVSGEGAEQRPFSSHDWGRIKFAAKLIPTFSGKDDGVVERWIERCASIARLHRITDDVLVTAAINQLAGRARNWLHRQPPESVVTWPDFSFQLRNYFERKEAITDTIARINRRFWRANSERFVDYAEDKLDRMQFLQLSEREKIEMLADGVRDLTLRRFAVDMQVSSVPQFMERFRRLVGDSVSQRRFESREGRPGARHSNASALSCTGCYQKGHSIQQCRHVDITCHRCKQKGHISPNCPIGRTEASTNRINHLERREEEEPEQTTPSMEQQAANSSVCVIEERTPLIKVRGLDCKGKTLVALVDTGSPVSLIRESTYLGSFRSNKLLRVKENLNLKGVNNSVIEFCGKIHDQLCLEKLAGHWFDVALFVVKDSTIAFDILLGRDFFDQSNLRLCYHTGVFEFESQTPDKEINYIFGINVTENKDRDDVILENLDPTLDSCTREKLLDVFHECDSSVVEPVRDDYCIRVHLKDSSFFRYAPRRMSVNERLELKEITDDLLARNIIKPSVSPYCARVILVNKRNGKKRMCIDLRSLNQRVAPQKFPFPIIEDQVDQLYGKIIFSKLDL
ncbi:uncharacterized protein LOC120357509 [Solenopsis invicta]|uniref:uncharacterized protein LOC120357509 n=1 Tax=Solenopsis invicta TaxID=13686 RepID=UPI00193CCD6B|nr:uncharacterized protein LOC120357509 [Solenopsis invicta]